MSAKRDILEILNETGGWPFHAIYDLIYRRYVELQIHRGMSQLTSGRIKTQAELEASQMDQGPFPDTRGADREVHSVQLRGDVSLAGPVVWTEIALDGFREAVRDLEAWSVPQRELLEEARAVILNLPVLEQGQHGGFGARFLDEYSISGLREVTLWARLPRENYRLVYLPTVDSTAVVAFVWERPRT